MRDGVKTLPYKSSSNVLPLARDIPVYNYNQAAHYKVYSAPIHRYAPAGDTNHLREALLAYFFTCQQFFCRVAW